tara:strand:+ start:11981 stop:12397 length:417 start_codon:yes stop_codon:yes gene_type:complete
MKTLLVTIIIASATLFSCKSPSKTINSEKTVSENSELPASTKETVFDIIIVFISKASGIDSELKAKIDSELASFNQKHKTNIKPEIVSWGREGERDYLFQTKNLSTKQKKELIGKIKAAIGSSDMAHIMLNKKSVHKR